MHHHQTLQCRLLIALGVVIVLGLLIGVPLTVNDDLRLDLALRTGLVPGKDAEQLTDTDDGALLIMVPLNNGNAEGTSPWLYRAQFIAWPNADGNELDHLGTRERVQVPLASIEFTSSNGDGSLILIRGPLADTGEMAAFTVEPGSMTVTQLPSADAVPDVPGDWATPSWEKTAGMCNRPSEEKRFVGCFTRADGASYLAGDWQLDVQIWGNFEVVHPLYRGQGFLPWMGFAENDTVVYLQNELGIVRIDIPEDILEDAPPGRPYATPAATPVAAVPCRQDSIE
jgi:hypothetical protein